MTAKNDDSYTNAEPPQADQGSAATPCSADWERNGKEWLIAATSGCTAEYRVLEFEGRWYPYTFYGLRYKRGKQLHYEGFESADEAKRCAEMERREDQLLG
jgi:hypothetical protein